MELLRYLLRNILKRPARALVIALSGAVAATVLVFTFALGAYTTEHVRIDTIAKWTGHLWVAPAKDFEFKSERIPEYTAQARAVQSTLSSDPNTRILVPWYVGYYEMQAGTARQYLMVTATDFQKDEPYKQETELVEGRYPGPSDEYGLLVTTVMAKKYQLNVGDSVTLFIPSAYGARNAMDFGIVGIYRASAPWYDDGVTMRVEDYIAMSELGDAFPFYKAYVKDERGIHATVAALKPQVSDFEVKGYRDDDFVRFLLNLGTTNIMLFGTMAMIIFLALLIGIRSIILTNIFVRREEIGTLRATGFSRAAVRNLFFGESLLALFAGYLVGTGAVAAIGAYFTSTIVRPPLLLLQYMFGMTRMAITLNLAAVLLPLLLLLGVLTITTFRTVGRETEKQAASQMANR